VARHHQQTAPDTPQRLEFTLRATRTAPREARRALSQLRLPLPLAFDAQLLVSELVSNSVRHAGLGRDDLIRVTADWSGDRLMVHVRDGGGPPRASPVSASIRPAPGAESGWGCTSWIAWPAVGAPPPTGTGSSCGSGSPIRASRACLARWRLVASADPETL
jgi:anti-sigma regulatory factor (Ser/Thr protein kinase)